MSLCGLKKKSYNYLLHSRPASAVSEKTNNDHESAPVPVRIPALKQSKGKTIQRKESISRFREEFQSPDDSEDWPLTPSKSANSVNFNDSDSTTDIHSIYRNEPQLQSPEHYLRRRRSSELRYEYAREDALSVILENLSETGSTTQRRSREQQWDSEDLAEVLEFSARHNDTALSSQPRIRGNYKKTRFEDSKDNRDSIPEYEYYAPEPVYRSRMSVSDKGSKGGDIPRPIAPPPRDLDSIARIDGSLIFEHFTTNDAWELGSALRNRLLPIATPVVINISLANQNQTLFHTCTHSGVMPDNDRWVARKRKTVLRWGCSTWYMHCKFNGDEFAFRDKYGLGNEAGDYAIHGGGVPIRVTGVEGVVAVVVVSGLKQDEDHAVVVEVIRELYY